MVASTLTLELLGVATVLLVGSVAMSYFLLRRAKDRRRQLTGEISEAREIVEDRAHNQIRIAVQEAAILERDRVDVARPRRLLEEAETAYRRQDFHHALQLARTAHDALVAMRKGSGVDPGPERVLGGLAPPAAGGRPMLDPSVESLDPLLPEGPRLESVPDEAERAPPGRTIPKNRMEARFQLSLLDEELARVADGGPGAAGVSEATQLAAEARAAEGREEYTEALGIALRARRKLGGKIESLPPPKGASALRPTLEQKIASTPSGSAGTAAQSSCPKCGRPVREEDAFCRSCGAPRGSLKCPRCAQPLEPTDQFCGSCGAPIT